MFAVCTPTVRLHCVSSESLCSVHSPIVYQSDALHNYASLLTHISSRIRCDACVIDCQTCVACAQQIRRTDFPGGIIWWHGYHVAKRRGRSCCIRLQPSVTYPVNSHTTESLLYVFTFTRVHDHPHAPIIDTTSPHGNVYAHAQPVASA